MIVAQLDQIAEQTAPTPNMQKALDFLRQVRGAELPGGRIEIDGDRVFALVQSYQTAVASDPVVFEAHQAYIDVQYMAAGQEVIAWAATDRLRVTEAYDPAKEAWFGALPAAETTFVRVAAGELAVLYPTDGHAPRLAAGAPAAVRKIVVKVAVDR
jgi:YhcH/YjgK/YiaL family protein